MNAQKLKPNGTYLPIQFRGNQFRLVVKPGKEIKILPKPRGINLGATAKPAVTPVTS